MVRKPRQTFLRTVGNFFIFIIIGIFYAIAPEYLNQILVQRSLGSYIATIILNTIFLLIGFVIWHVLKRITSNAFKIYFLIAGIFGLLFEWFLVGNNLFSHALQLAMFAYWTGLLTLPVILLDRNSKLRRSSFLALICVAIAQFILATILISQGALIFAGLVVAASSFVLWWWPLQYLHGSDKKLKASKYALIIIAEVLIELALPKPMGAIAGFAVFVILWKKYC